MSQEKASKRINFQLISSRFHGESRGVTGGVARYYAGFTQTF